MKKLNKITEKVMLDAVKACADHYVRTELKTGRGFPDCLVVFNGVTFFVEVKTKNDKVSQAQYSFSRKFPTLFIWPDTFENVSSWDSPAILARKVIGYIGA